MRNHLRLIYFFTSLLCVCLGAGISYSTEVNSYPTADIPIFHAAYNVNKTVNDSNETVTVNYHVQTVHPAAEVLAFYDTYFNGKGWISSFETCQRNWADYGDSAQSSESPVRLVFASWEHAGSNRKVLLWIRHERQSNQAQEEVVVEYQLRPITQ